MRKKKPSNKKKKMEKKRRRKKIGDNLSQFHTYVYKIANTYHIVDVLLIYMWWWTDWTVAELKMRFSITKIEKIKNKNQHITQASYISDTRIYTAQYGVYSIYNMHVLRLSNLSLIVFAVFSLFRSYIHKYWHMVFISICLTLSFDLYLSIYHSFTFPWVSLEIGTLHACMHTFRFGFVSVCVYEKLKLRDKKRRPKNHTHTHKKTD